MSIIEVLRSNHNDLSDHDLAHLADWANALKNNTPNPHWKRAYSLIREGADLLLRRRAMSAVQPENEAGNVIQVNNLEPISTGKPVLINSNGEK